eukprot:1200782-Amphidinium_carterae.1
MSSRKGFSMRRTTTGWESARIARASLQEIDRSSGRLKTSRCGCNTDSKGWSCHSDLCAHEQTHRMDSYRLNCTSTKLYPSRIAFLYQEECFAMNAWLWEALPTGPAEVVARSSCFFRPHRACLHHCRAHTHAEHNVMHAIKRQELAQQPTAEQPRDVPAHTMEDSAEEAALTPADETSVPEMAATSPSAPAPKENVAGTPAPVAQ